VIDVGWQGTGIGVAGGADGDAAGGIAPEHRAQAHRAGANGCGPGNVLAPHRIAPDGEDGAGCAYGGDKPEHIDGACWCTNQRARHWDVFSLAWKAA
jgi:hypothetical protein